MNESSSKSIDEKYSLKNQWPDLLNWLLKCTLAATGAEIAWYFFRQLMMWLKEE